MGRLERVLVGLMADVLPDASWDEGRDAGFWQLLQRQLNFNSTSEPQQLTYFFFIDVLHKLYIIYTYANNFTATSSSSP